MRQLLIFSILIAFSAPHVQASDYRYGYESYRSYEPYSPSYQSESYGYGGYTNPDPMNRGLNATIRANEAAQRQRQMNNTLQNIEYDLMINNYRR